MATATTMPEFFSNLISTFVVQSDMGVGNILGSLMFNTLMVAATIGFFDTKGGQVDWWQGTRDCTVLAFNLTMLTIFGWDGRIEWWEGLILFVFVFVYYTIMFQNERIKRFFSYYINDKWNCCHRYVAHRERIENAEKKLKSIEKVVVSPMAEVVHGVANKTKSTEVDKVNHEPVKERKSLWKIPQGTRARKFWWFYSWPIKLVLTCLIPSPKSYRFLYPLTFIMSIVVIGLNSYMTVWMLTAIGYTFGIPESVMGLTILAVGGCLPEFFSGLISALNGEGGSNFSNSLGTNSLSILFSLGFPWFLKGVINQAQGLPGYIRIGSYGIEYIIISLVLMSVILYTILYIGNFRLRSSMSCILVSVYFVFLAFAVLIELDIIAPGTGGLC